MRQMKNCSFFAFKPKRVEESTMQLSVAQVPEKETLSNNLCIILCLCVFYVPAEP